MEQNKVFFQREVERLTELQLNLFGSRGKRHKHRFRQKRYYQEIQAGKLCQCPRNQEGLGQERPDRRGRDCHYIQ